MRDSFYLFYPCLSFAGFRSDKEFLKPPLEGPGVIIRISVNQPGSGVQLSQF